MSQRNGQRKPEEIESDIHQARERLDDTLHELEEKLSPQQLIDMSYDYFRHGGAHDFASRLVNTVKRNPLPVLVTGVGLGWLMLSQRNAGHRHEREYRAGYRAGYPGSTIPTQRMPNGGLGDDSMTGAGTTSLGHDPAALNAYGDDDTGHDDSGMTGKARHMMDQMRDGAHRVGDDLRDRSRHAREGARANLGTVTHRARDVGSQSTHFVQEHPLVAGVLGVALGAALGGIFSPTRVENEHLGDLRDRAVERATEAGREQVEKAQEAIHEKAEEARSRGEFEYAKAGGADRSADSSPEAKGDAAAQDPASMKGANRAEPEADNHYSSKPDKG